MFFWLMWFETLIKVFPRTKRQVELGVCVKFSTAVDGSMYVVPHSQSDYSLLFLNNN